MATAAKNLDATIKCGAHCTLSVENLLFLDHLFISAAITARPKV